MEQTRLETRPSLTLQRHYPVAPEKVWRAWTDAQALKHWFGPGGPQKVALAELDLRVGGCFRLAFGGADGNEHEAAGVYKEVQPHRRLVFTWCWPRTTPDRVSQITILLRAQRGGTDMEFRQEQFFDEAARDGHLRGWSESLVKLEVFLQQA